MKTRKLISLQDVEAAASQKAKTLVVPEGAIVTDAARDLARNRQIELVAGPEFVDGASSSVRTIAVGSDHGGFDFKSQLIPFINDLGWKVSDVGTDSSSSCDYPDFAFAVAHLVSTGKVRFGLMIDGAGVGSAMVCNKVNGVRAACAYNEFVAWNARAHNDANVLTLGSRTMGIEVCKSMIKTFLSTEFEGGRHAKRTSKIDDVELNSAKRASGG
ncbi:MAG: ribose 5-phosphate isomerase B [Rhodothermales bacterium]|nr:ribose 5-phosphate isomerase B [Rhodothermales bacterium]